ncbi:MAG: hypothetical protein E5X86_12610 [Mesorhizobium sp.]|uniref:hypothetical protein n=1 Tax=Mesorhizobium sp. TaxID=1871066 RepID=UPI000FE67649|nr:hypothetical protein [Mesorhizobium sp.]RWM79351.1 MAG: hypothetical protein EOR83_29610 [Mesorhizobium sp.]TIO17253.1 MAG: hypothetical protein E5X86_12610 [Mesorhizobium sp.]
MRNAILENVLRPLLARFGTALAAILLTYGFESQVVEPFVNAVGALLLLGVDLLLSRYYRKLAVKRGES